MSSNFLQPPHNTHHQNSHQVTYSKLFFDFQNLHLPDNNQYFVSCMLNSYNDRISVQFILSGAGSFVMTLDFNIQSLASQQCWSTDGIVCIGSNGRWLTSCVGVNYQVMEGVFISSFFLTYQPLPNFSYPCLYCLIWWVKRSNRCLVWNRYSIRNF